MDAARPAQDAGAPTDAGLEPDAGPDVGPDAGPGSWHVEYVRPLLEDLDYLSVTTESAERVEWTGRYFLVWGSCATGTGAGRGGLHVYDEEGNEVGSRNLCYDSERINTGMHAWNIVNDIDIVDEQSWVISMSVTGQLRPAILYRVGEGPRGPEVQLVGRTSRGFDAVMREGLPLYAAASHAAVSGDRMLLRESRSANTAAGTALDDPRTGTWLVLLSLPDLRRIWEQETLLFPEFGVEGTFVLHEGGAGAPMYFDLAGDVLTPRGEVSPAVRISADGGQAVEWRGDVVGGQEPRSTYRWTGARYEASGTYEHLRTPREYGESVEGDFVSIRWNLWRRGQPVLLPEPPTVFPEYRPTAEGGNGANIMDVGVSPAGWLIVTTGYGAHLLRVVPDA